MNRKNTERRLANLEASMIGRESCEVSNRKRVNSHRDSINRLHLKIGYLECPKHVYKFTRVRNLNENPYYQLWAFPMLGMLPNNRYVFTCTKCIKEIELKESELSMVQSASLIALGLLESKAVVKK